MYFRLSELLEGDVGQRIPAPQAQSGSGGLPDGVGVTGIVRRASLLHARFQLVDIQDEPVTGCVPRADGADGVRAE